MTPDSKPITLGLCSVIIDCPKDYFMEWINHHRDLGVDYFFLHDNDSVIPITELIKDLPFRKSITVFKILGSYVNRQHHVFVECCNKIKTGALPLCDRVAFIDDDEFIRCKIDFKTFLSQFTEFSGLGLNWKVFGSSGHIEKPIGLQKDNFTQHTDVSHGVNRHIKTIANPLLVEFFENTHFCLRYTKGHSVNVKKETLTSAFCDANHSIAWIDHFFTRSKNEFIQKMELRNSQGRSSKLTMEMFHEVNKTIS